MEEAFAKDNNSHSLVLFLDSLNTLEELVEVEAFVAESYPDNTRTVAFTRECLKLWPNPDEGFSDDFGERFPLVMRKLDTPPKKRVFLRGARFCCADPEFLAKIVESILHEHEVGGKDVVRMKLHTSGDEHNPKNAKCFVASVLARYTQWPAWTLQLLLLSGSASGTTYGKQKFNYWDWRPEEEKGIESLNAVYELI
ncbi:hypothetical protein KKA15_06500 [Patescibacteria group bacterium]|nr:hypothetical protein [Patescibacteria group bacterium]